MKAMILAAGLGTRLRPLTDHKPKALVEIGGTPLLEIAIRRLKAVGVKEIIVNVHHFAEQIIQFLNDKNNFGIRIEISDERGELLETGGGLKKAYTFLADGSSFFLYNADIVADFDLKAMYQQHLKTHALVTLAVSKRNSSRFLVFDQYQMLCGWMGINTHDLQLSRKVEGGLQLLAFSGIHVIHPAIFKKISEEGKFSIIETYRRLAAIENIQAFIHDASSCIDAGKPEQLELAAELYKKMNFE